MHVCMYVWINWDLDQIFSLFQVERERTAMFTKDVCTCMTQQNQRLHIIEFKGQSVSPR